jgi:hypothetical protein
MTPQKDRFDLPQQFSHGSRHSDCDLGHLPVIQGIRCVSGQVVIGISKKAGVGQHQRGVALIPKGTVVAQPYLVNPLRQADRKQRHASSALLESSTKLPHRKVSLPLAFQQVS